MCDREDLPCEEELDSPANRRLRSTRRLLSQTPTRITPSALATRTPAHALRLAPLDAAGKGSTPDLARMNRSLTEGCDDRIMKSMVFAEIQCVGPVVCADCGMT
jgi:hypothetical protein